MPDQMTLPPNADPAEVVELGIHEQNLKEAALAAIVGIQGMGVRPPEPWEAFRAYTATLEAASHQAVLLAEIASDLARHLNDRIIAIINERQSAREVPMT